MPHYIVTTFDYQQDRTYEMALKPLINAKGVHTMLLILLALGAYIHEGIDILDPEYLQEAAFSLVDRPECFVTTDHHVLSIKCHDYSVITEAGLILS